MRTIGKHVHVAWTIPLQGVVSSEFAAPMSHEPVNIGKQSAVTLPSSRQALFADFLNSNMQTLSGNERQAPSNPSCKNRLRFPKSFIEQML